MDSNKEEQLLFDVKQKFLREIPHPTIIRKNAERLASSVSLELNFEKQVLVTDVSLENFLENTISELMTIKLKVSNSQNAEELAHSLLQLWKVQSKLIARLASYEIDNRHESFTTVKMSDPLDPYKILKYLRSSLIRESEINDYLCRAFEKLDSEPLSILTEAVVRAKKIIDYEQVR